MLTITLIKDMEPKTEKSRIFSDQAIKNIAAFSEVLKKIHIRLISEGYVIEDGKVYKPEEKQINNVVE
jgi:hypothetical protein